MALRNIVERGDEILAKKCREVKEVNDHIRMILDDMLETMRAANGVGIAAPQVGINRRMFIVEVDGETYEMINPVMLEQSGSQCEYEGCLSVPGLYGRGERPMYIKIAGLNRFGEPVEYEAEGFLATAFCHENDHLDGQLFIDKAVDICTPEELYGEDDDMEE